ncbi:nucleoside triphosphate pyrophosphohydrolase [Nitratireductor rhodophyticola]|uniref:nucleoside triphosphate pyrophosphohydrolase n=1 Tax=Nitratireductor rhodophyticola TaxID=2854036 RepID=UPI00300BBA77
MNCEWVRRGDTFFVVQIDVEDDDIYGINPLQLDVEPSITAHLQDGEILRAGLGPSRKQWDKLRVLDELDEGHTRPSGSLFYVPIEQVIVENREALRTDFQRLLEKNIVVRTSTEAGKKITNLPKTDCLSPDAAVDWCLENAEGLRSRHPNEQLAFIAHRYIASRSSAWVRADPDTPIVEVHGIWGLPDGIQFCPFDIWEIHIPTEEITEYTNYKSNVLLLQPNGTWRYQRVRNEVARFQSIGKSDVLDLAKRSHAIASRMKQACHIMWFVGCLDEEGISSNIPWYWTKAHSTENLDRGNYQMTIVKNSSDLSYLGEMKGRYQRLAIVLKPDSVDLLRNNDFLEAVARSVKPLDVPVILEGSTLAHAFYQLTKHGCTVIADAEKDHSRARRQMNFGKLVRDGIPEKIARQQEQHSVATVPRGARLGYLIGKFIEEVLEAREADKPDLRAELADIFEVLRAVSAVSGEAIEDVIAEADRKRAKVGGFDEGKVLITTSLPTAQSSAHPKASRVITGAQIERVGPAAYRVPFSYLGFAEIGQAKVLKFEGVDHDIQITLQRDCVELTMVRHPVQLRLQV